jgi:hypothetical protein
MEQAEAFRKECERAVEREVGNLNVKWGDSKAVEVTGESQFQQSCVDSVPYAMNSLDFWCYCCIHEQTPLTESRPGYLGSVKPTSDAIRSNSSH